MFLYTYLITCVLRSAQFKLSYTKKVYCNAWIEFLTYVLVFLIVVDEKGTVMLCFFFNFS